MDDQIGQGDLEDILEARRRIVAAFEGIAADSEALAQHLAEAPDPAELDRLRAAIEEERVVNAQLSERNRVLHERAGHERAGASAADGRVADLEQGLARAREEVAGHEARRAAERAEMDEVLAELIPLIEEAR